MKHQYRCELVRSSLVKLIKPSLANCSFILSNASWWHASQCQGFFLVLFLRVTLVWPHSPTRLVRGASKWLHFSHKSLLYWAIPRNLRSSLTAVGGLIASMADTFSGWGFIPSRVRTYPRYSISASAKYNFAALTRRLTPCNQCNTLSTWVRFSSK